MTELHQQKRPIKVSQAHLKTATITVKALTIDKRQVTLAVFRQLWEASVVDSSTGKLLGVPWGVINYCPDKKWCADLGPHLHVIWQMGDELRRDAVTEPKRPYAIDSDHGEQWLIAALAGGWRPNDRDAWKSGRLLINFGKDLPSLSVGIEWQSDRKDLAHALGEDLRHQGKEYENDWEKRTQAEERESIERGKQLIELATDEQNREGHENAISAELRAHKELWDNMEMRWKEIQALDQIFIAT